jgi:peptide/nickel transport system substrate-binding protein
VRPLFLDSLLPLALALVFLAAGCGGERQEPSPEGTPAEASLPVRGDTIVRGSIADASNLIPIVASDSASFDIADLVYNGLVRYDKDLNVEGSLAESWEISSDGLEIIFHLRRGVKWHDGAPFSAEDVRFTYELLVDPETPTAYAEDFLQVKGLEVLDEHTVRVSYGEPFAPALISWGMYIVPKHLLEGEDLTTSPLARRPVGTGPYRFAEWRTGEQIVLEAYEDYWEGRPRIDRHITRVIPDTATMFLELKAGNVDWMELDPLQYTRQTETEEFRRDFHKFRHLEFMYTYLGFNLEDPRFSDRRVRQAIAYAVDKQELVDIVLHGLGQVATGHYKPGSWAYNPDVKRYPHDPARARELLASAGWEDRDGDGWLDREGERFSFTIVTNQGNRKRAMSAEIIQGRLKEVGIDVSIRIVEWAAFLRNFVRPRNFEAVILGWRTVPDPDAYDVWHSSKTGPNELNHVSFRNAEVDELLEEGRRTFRREERRKAYFRIQEILAVEQPYVFLFAPESLPIIHSRFRGIEIGEDGILTSNFIRWWVPKGEQRYLH